ncbi:YybS family protein [Oceanobacillus damuensis]|uniref:YybS family protein n=1 Tax=Oceanobacillus damuensis TaxID=937928 RepID=UPI00083048B1|nr:YybS family protein [Oceanobacillus damuensis]
MNQSRKMTDGALLLAIFMVILLVTIFVPVLSVFSMFFLPVPFVLFASRHGFKPSLVMFAVSLVLATMFATFFSLPLALLMGLGGITVGSAIYKEYSPYETWARGTFGFVIGLLFVFVSSQMIFSVNWVDELEVMVTDSLEMSSSLMESFGVAEQSEEFEALIQLQVQTMIDLLPVGLALSALVLAFLSQWISYKFINRLEKKELRFSPFRNLRFPPSILWIYFFALIFSFISRDPSSFFFTAVQNVLVLTGLIMTMQGFSFIFYYAYHKKISKSIPIFIVILTILFPTFLLYFIRILGIIDIGFRLRDHLENKK